MYAKSLPEAPVGFRWASMSKVDPETGSATFEAKEDGKVRVSVTGHICHLVAVDDKAAKAVFNDEPGRTFYDPTTGEDFTVTGLASAAAKILRHKAESGRGAARMAASKAGEVMTDLDRVQKYILGDAPVTEEMIDQAFEEGPEAVKALLKSLGKLK